MSPNRSICVYCGSSSGLDERHLAAGRELGKAIAAAGLRLVYGGGNRGIMGAVSDATIRGGGRVLGIIPQFLVRKESAQEAPSPLDELVVTEDMHTRKHRMFEESDAFVALPGGIGTVEEIVEVMTWAQLGHHHKPIVFANIAGFWNPMLAMLDHMRSEGFIHTGNRVKPLVVETAGGIVPAIRDAWDAVETDPEGETGIIERL